MSGLGTAELRSSKQVGAVGNAIENRRGNSSRNGPSSTSLSSKNQIGHFLLSKTMGEGTFGEVKLAIHRPTSEKVAAKVRRNKGVREAERGGCTDSFSKIWPNILDSCTRVWERELEVTTISRPISTAVVARMVVIRAAKVLQASLSQQSDVVSRTPDTQAASHMGTQSFTIALRLFK